MEHLTPKKTIRVSYCDPDATDSSSDEGADKSQKKFKRKVHEIDVEFVEKNQDPGYDSGDFEEETGFKKPNLTSEGEKMVGVRKMRSGKFWAEIKDPIKRRWVCLGVFGTAEAACRAYLAQESMFATAKLRANQAASQNSPFQYLVPSVLDSHYPAGKQIEGVVRSKSGKFGASIIDPFKRKRVWLGSFTTAEEASRAHLAEKAQLEAKKLRFQKLQLEAKMLRAKRRIDGAASGKSTFQDSVSSVLGNETPDLTSFQGGARTRVSDVRRRISGKFSAETTDPITQRRVCLGTFATEEEASRAYLAMEAEFAAEKLRANRRIDPVASDESSFRESVSSDLGNGISGLTSFQESARTRISDARSRNSGKFSAEITDPITRRRVWIGTFATAEATSSGHLAQESKFAGEKMTANQAASENSPFEALVRSGLDSHNPEGKQTEGVRRTKSGRFGASIRDSFKKKDVWLGSFTTAEEASRAYLAKKAQLEAKMLRVQKAQFEAKMLRAKRRIDRVASGKSTFQDISDLTSFQGVARTRISGVYRTNSGKFSAAIAHPITKRRVWIGTFASKQKASRAYRAKEAEFEEELRLKQCFERVASEKSLATGLVSSVMEIETSDLSNETGGVESVGENKVLGDQEAGFGFFNGVQVVDKNGFLVGEFSMLDDFSICSEEEDANS